MVLQQALSKARAVGDVQLMAWVMNDIADVEIERDEWGTALELTRRARRLVLAEELREHFVHAAEVAAVLEEHVAFHDVGHARAAAFQNARNIAEHLPGLLAHVAGHGFAGFRIDRNLPGNIEEIARANCR